MKAYILLIYLCCIHFQLPMQIGLAQQWAQAHLLPAEWRIPALEQFLDLFPKRKPSVEEIDDGLGIVHRELAELRWPEAAQQYCCLPDIVATDDDIAELIALSPLQGRAIQDQQWVRVARLHSCGIAPAALRALAKASN